MPSFSAGEGVEPTFARESSVQVARGGEIEITLEAVPDYGNHITFEIQETPLHGSLSAPSNVTDHTATVTYHHDGSKTSLVDAFSFRAQAPGHAKSSACKVSIAVIPPPAHLVFEPGELDFGSLLVDQERRTNLVMRNVGGSKVTGHLILPQGYSVTAGDGFSLNEGESSRVLVEFHPQEAKDYSGSATVLAQCEQEPLLLKGIAQPRFEVIKTGPLGCVVKNISEESLRLSFSGDAAWIMPPETSIPPHEEKSFLFQEIDREGAVSPVVQSSAVQISDGLAALTVELPPPHGFIPLTMSGDPSLELGNIPLGASLPVKFTLLNRSEDSKHAVWIATSSSGGGMASAIPVELHGGEAREIKFDWRPTEPGQATLKISVEEGTKTHHELLWHTTVVSSTMNDSSPEAPENQSNAAESPSAQAGQRLSITELLKIVKAIPPLEGASWSCKVPWFGKPSVTVKWDANQGDDSEFLIQEQVIRMTGNQENQNSEENAGGTSPFNVELFPVEAIREEKQGDQEMCRLPKLSAGWHLIVVSKISKNGEIQGRAQLQVFVPKSRSWWNSLKIPLAVLAVFLLIAFLWKQREGSFSI